MIRNFVRWARAVVGALVARPAVAEAAKAAPARTTSRDGLAAGERDFAFELHRQIATRGGNVFCSPYSVSTALAMTAVGARGETAAELRNALHLPERYAQEYRALATSIASIPQVDEYDAATRQLVEKPAYVIAIANAIYSQAGWEFSPEFRKHVHADFRGEFNEIDFRQPEVARAAINAWVAEQTDNRIKDIIGEGQLTRDTAMLLANAIHFKGAWAAPFLPEATQNGAFITADSRSVTAQRMHLIHRLPYAETRDAQLLELAYQGDTVTMVVVLPKARQGLSTIEKNIDGSGFDRWIATLKPMRVDVRMPKFTIASAFDLVPAMVARGVRTAFSPAADFSGIAESPKLYIDAILHKAFVEVDEQGTEAAAATEVMFLLSGSPPAPKPVAFTVDRPFLFAIRHVPTGAILFVGRVTDPTR